MEPEFVRRGRELTARGSHLEAVKVCRLGLLAHPSQLDGRLILGRALLALGRFDEVLAEMRVALELDGLNGTAMVLKGEALLGRGDHRQALDVLEKAARQDPNNPRVPELLARTRDAIERGGSGIGDADPSISWTRNYPGYRVADDDGSNRTTLPGEGPTAIDPLDVFVTADTELASLDEAGEPSMRTIEIDPELDAIEIRPTAVDPDFGGPTVRDVTGEPEELASSDLIPVMPPTSSQEVSGFDEGFGSASDPTHGYRGRKDIFEEPFTTPEDGESLDFEAPLFLDSEPGRPKRPGFPSDQPRPRRPAPPLDPPAEPVLDELFPEDEDGVSKLEIVDDETGLPRAFLKQPHQGRRPPPRALSSGESFAPPRRGDDTRERRRSDDMRVIREGLGLSADPSRGAIPTAALPQRAPRRRQAPPTSLVRAGRDAAPTGGRRISVLAAVILAVILIGGGVAGGVVLRGWRTDQQLDAATERVRGFLQTGNYLDHLRAASLLDRALELRGSDELQALRARVGAAIADEFGVPGDAAARVEALGGDSSRDALVARAHLALARGEIARALELAGQILERSPDRPIGLYLRGRAELERGQLDAARATFEKLHKPGATPLVTARLAEVNRLAGRHEVALALAGEGDIPALEIARARAMAGAGELESGDPPEPALEALIADGQLPPARQKIGVSPRQVAEARLALVELGLARGKPEAAGAQLEALARTEVRDGSFLAAYTEALIGAGDLEAAAAAQKKLAAVWPDHPRAVVLGARLALRGGDTLAARAALESLTSPDKIPRALAIRGELALEAGRLGDAAKDLDAAIAANPGLIDASLARARVDLARGKPREALARLEKLPAAHARERDIIQARAFRQLDEVERARGLLDKLARARYVPAMLELARLEREAGKSKKALGIYDAVLEIEAANPIAAVERANLELEEGEPQAAARRLDGLVEKRPNDARVLLAAARAKSLMGDPGAAGALVDRAAKIAGTPGWLVDRERGHSLLRLGKLEEATTALRAAAKARPTDGETWLLLMEVHYRNREGKAAAEVLKNATVPLDNSHVLALLRGIEALTSDQLERAVRDFQTALVVARGSTTQFERARVLYWKGKAHLSIGQLSKARTELSRAVKLDPRNADAYLMLGEVEFEDGNTREAVESYRRSAQLDPVANPKVHFLLGELYFKSRNFRLAAASLEQYLALVPDSPLAKEAKRILDEIK